MFNHSKKEEELNLHLEDKGGQSAGKFELQLYIYCYKHHA